MRTAVRGPCPVCESDIEYIYETDNIPYFYDTLIISTVCPSCGYRYADTQPLKSGEPCRWEFPIESPDDLSVRVVRSAQSRVSIPELGVNIDPGPACEGFVSNIEGLLERVTQAVVLLVTCCDDPGEKERGEEFLARIVQVKEGSLPVTVIIEDPSGTSSIVSEKARKTSIDA